MAKIKPYETKQLKFKDPSHPGQDYFIFRYKANMTIPQIRAFAQAKSNEVKAKLPNSQLFSVTLRFANGIFKGGKRTQPGEPVDIWDPADSDEVLDDDAITGFDILTTIPRVDKNKVNEVAQAEKPKQKKIVKKIVKSVKK